MTRYRNSRLRSVLPVFVVNASEGMSCISCMSGLSALTDEVLDAHWKYIFSLPQHDPTRQEGFTIPRRRTRLSGAEMSGVTTMQGVQVLPSSNRTARTARWMFASLSAINFVGVMNMVYLSPSSEKFWRGAG